TITDIDGAAEVYTVQLASINNELEAGGTYVMSGRIKYVSSTDAASATLNFVSGISGINLYGQSVNNEEWTVFEFDTLTTDTAVTAAPGFHLSDSNLENGDVYYVDNIRIEKIGESDTDEPAEITAIADARTYQDSSLVISGIASTPNYGFNNGQWFLQDETGGINVIFFGEGDIEVEPGDEHILYGTISSYEGQVQIDVDSAEVVSTGNDVLVYEIGLDEFLNVESDYQGQYVALTDTATYLSEISDWPVEDFDGWSGSGTNVYFQVAEDTITYRIDRDEAFFDGTAEPADGEQFLLSGILSRFNEEAQFYGGFFEDDILTPAPAPTPLPVPEPPYAVGDTLNYNGSLTLSDVGATAPVAWTISLAEGSSAEVVGDAADEDGKALAVTVAWSGTTNWYENEAVNEPINVVEGETYEASVWLKADEEGRSGRFYAGMPASGSYERARGFSTPVSELTTEWQRVAFTFTATEAQATNGMRVGVETNAEVNDGGVIYIDDIVLQKVEGTSNEVGDQPLSFKLDQNYPNPFNPTTNISYAIPEATQVTLEVFNMLGQKVKTLVNERQVAGSKMVSFDASSLASGVYIYRLQAGSFVKSQRMTLIK
ncbi:MAG TPA: hypothetical protein DD671_02315, partial [Balneolaceae bacterium]|nr:hypothetical protein [Balneolaceae bacterium]